MVMLQFLLASVVGWVSRDQQDIIRYLWAERSVLRRQLRRRIRFTKEQRARLGQKGQALGPRLLKEIEGLVTPQTILRWYRTLIAKEYDSSKRRSGSGSSKPRTTIAELVVQLAKEHPDWSSTSLRNFLLKQGRNVTRETVQRILREHGLEPKADRCRKGMSWKTFLSTHWEQLAAADFFTVEVLSLTGLRRYFVFFVMELHTRRVHIAGITAQPNEAWMMQIARNLKDCEDGFLLDKKYIILDRDPLYTPKFRNFLRESETKPVRLPRRSPNLNAYAERWILSIRSECLNHLIPLGEHHLRSVIREYVEHYHHGRYHQGLEGRLIEPDARVGVSEGDIVCHKRLGGLLRFYHREAGSASK